MKNLHKAERPYVGFFLDLVLLSIVVLTISLLPADVLLTLFLVLLALAMAFALFTRNHP